jgi:hypothetical protein
MLEDDVSAEFLLQTVFWRRTSPQAGNADENQSDKEELLNQWSFKYRECIAGVNGRLQETEEADLWRTFKSSSF